MRRVLPLLLGAVGVGFAVILIAARKSMSTISYDPQLPASGGYMTTITIPKQLTAEIIASARRWADIRGIPLQEVLATILVESSGNPRAWANKANEDSRGLMQVNINAWKSLLTQNGMTVDDLWNIDKNIQIGTYIYAQYRKAVADLIAKSGVPQAAPLDALTRLYYKGPAYVKSKILAGKDASSPYKDADKALANWKLAMGKVSAVV